MILGPAAGQMWSGGGSGGGGGGGGGGSTPPDNAPVAVGLSFVPGTARVRVSWTDPTGTFAHIQVGVFMENTGAGSVEPTYAMAIVGPGIGYFDSSFNADSLDYTRDGSALTDWWVRSENDGLVSAWVYVGNSLPPTTADTGGGDA